MPDAPTPKPRRRMPRIAIVLVAVLVLAVGLATMGVLGRWHDAAELGRWTRAQATPTVALVEPTRGTKSQELVLPGDIQAWYEAPIYARVSGYLKMWYVDIGAQVKAGQLLAEIDTPELDQQLAQAKNDLGSAEADASLAALTSARWSGLLKTQAVSQQSADEKAGDAVSMRAKAAAARSNVDRLQALEGFKRIVAPFDGVVTARQTDIGALITGGSGSGVELFKVADIHQMRVYVRVPQSYSGVLRTGMAADLKLPQFADRHYKATLLTTSNAVTEASRTVLVELVADNADRTLWPGNFAEVHFELPADPDSYRLPTSALLFREHGLEVATVGPDDKVALKPISIGRDLGTEVEITSGVTADDRVIDSPPDSIGAGDLVRPAAASGPQVADEKPAGHRE